MFIVLPETTNAAGQPETMNIKIHLGGRDRTMAYALIGRIKPTLIPGKPWGLYATASMENLIEKRQRTIEKTQPDIEFRIVPIQHGFNPYDQPARDFKRAPDGHVLEGDED